MSFDEEGFADQAPLGPPTLERLLEHGPTVSFLNRVYDESVVAKIADKFDLQKYKGKLARSLKEAGYSYMTGGPIGRKAKGPTELRKAWDDVGAGVDLLWKGMYGLGDDFLDGLLRDFQRNHVQLGSAASPFDTELLPIKNDDDAQMFVRRFLRTLRIRADEKAGQLAGKTRPGPRRGIGIEAFVYELGSFWLWTGRPLTIDNHPGAISPALSFMHSAMAVLHEIPSQKLVTAARTARDKIQAHRDMLDSVEDSVSRD